MKDIVHGDADFGIPEKAFVQSYLANSHLPSLVQKPHHCEINTWETYRVVSGVSP